MTVPLWCLLAFAAWTVGLVFSVITWRSVMVLRGIKQANEFMAGVPHGPDLYWRLNRAHMNAVENLTVFGAIVLVAHAAGVNGGMFAQLAQVYVGARVVQSIAHVTSNAVGVVYVRFSALVVQLACAAGMIGIVVASR